MGPLSTIGFGRIRVRLVTTEVGVLVGPVPLWELVGTLVGCSNGAAVGVEVGIPAGFVGEEVGLPVGRDDGGSVIWWVGTLVGSFLSG